LWYQVVDKTAASLSGNYIETSGSAMFIYALRVACDSNWISRTTYMPVAQSAWTGLQAKISTNGDGMPQINDFAPAMGVQNTEALYVQASLQSVDCPSSTHPHGYAAILFAASAMEFGSTLPVSFSSFTAKEYTAKTTLSWQMGDESDVDHYEIQKSTNGNDFTTIGTVLNNGTGTYNFDDNTVESKTVYYRINAVYKNASAHYSMTLSVKKNNRAQSFEISPNPVKGGDMNFVASNLKPGNYNIRIVSTAGYTVYTTTVTINQEIAGQHLQLPGTIAKGVYYVRLTGDGITMNKNIVIE
jgi:Glycosyl Hydrolase Family 88